MTKRMRELLDAINNKGTQARAFLDSKKKDDARKVLDEIKDLKEEYEMEKELFENAAGAIEDTAPIEPTNKKADGFSIINKLLNKKKLNDVENSALVTGGENGENYLIPEDVRLEINLLRKSYKSAKDVVTIMPTMALSGSINYEVDDNGELTAFSDGEEIDEEGAPSFRRSAFTIGFFGRLIPVSNILIGAEKAGLMNYIKTWFVRKAIRTENKRIFAKLKENKKELSLAGWESLKSSINLLDPSTLIDGMIVTNQTGWDHLDSAKDANGRPILKENPMDKTQRTFQNLQVHVYSNDELKNVGGKAPIFFGSTKAGVNFVEYMDLQFASSEHIFFGKNQLALRVIEGFDVMNADKDAYEYALMDVTGHEITFTVKNGETAVTGVVITVDDNNVTTSAGGTGKLTLPNGRYSYSASKDGLVTATGSFIVSNAVKAVAIAITTA